MDMTMRNELENELEMKMTDKLKVMKLKKEELLDELCNMYVEKGGVTSKVSDRLCNACLEEKRINAELVEMRNEKKEHEKEVLEKIMRELSIKESDAEYEGVSSFTDERGVGHHTFKYIEKEEEVYKGQLQKQLEEWK